MEEKTKKFGKIKKEHPRVNINRLDVVLNEIKKMDSKKSDITITKIAENLGIKRTRVGRAVKWLVQYKYIKKAGKGERIPFFRITYKKKSDFIFGRKNIELIINTNLDCFEKNIVNEELNKLKKLLKDNFSKFFVEQNKIVEMMWRKSKGTNELSKIEIVSKAIRYNLLPTAE